MMIVQIATGLLGLYSALSVSVQAPSEPASTAVEETPAAEVTTKQFLSVYDLNAKEGVEQYVKQYFADTPILAEVARCESTYRQVTSGGSVIRGEKNRYDVGIMQINEIYHLERAKKMGLDIDTVEGNLAYAKFLYERYGLQPWSSSSKCWKNTEAYSDYKADKAASQIALNS